MKILQKLDEIAKKPHPVAKGVDLQLMLTKAADGLDVSCVLVSVPVGKEVPEHDHAEQVDIAFPLQGKGMMYVEGQGEFPVEPGSIVHVPKGVKHRIFNVTEDLLLYEVFTPALF